MKDWRGTEIKQGQTVIYGVKSGSAGVEQRIAEVIEIVPGREADFDRGRYSATEDKVRLRVTAMNRGPMDITRSTLVMPHMLTVIELPPVAT